MPSCSGGPKASRTFADTLIKRGGLELSCIPPIAVPRPTIELAGHASGPSSLRTRVGRHSESPSDDPASCAPFGRRSWIDSTGVGSEIDSSYRRVLLVLSSLGEKRALSTTCGAAAAFDVAQSKAHADATAAVDLILRTAGGLGEHRLAVLGGLRMAYAVRSSVA